jgi:valyl-tRNA synthetase
METGRDILFQWVSRMVMLGLYRTGKVPFKNVYLHGLVNDAHGKKMSKSKGNVLNPLVLTDKYGTDALRLALTIGITPGNDGALSEAKIEGYRNFCNKLWNVARFILGQLPEDYSPAAPELRSPADHWLAAKLDTATVEVTRAIEDYRFSDAGQLVYSLLWDDFADWYIEASKLSPNHDLLLHGLQIILKLLHPIAPFVTEAIWSHYPWPTNQLITEAWPAVDTTRTKSDLSSANLFESVKSTVQAARTIMAEEQLSKVTILTTDQSLAESAELIKRLARAGAVELVKEGSGLYLGTLTPAWIKADQATIEGRRTRLEQQKNEKADYLKSLTAKLSNAKYTESAPAKIVEETRARHAETQDLIAHLESQLKALDAN